MTFKCYADVTGPYSGHNGLQTYEVLFTEGGRAEFAVSAQNSGNDMLYGLYRDYNEYMYNAFAPAPDFSALPTPSPSQITHAATPLPPVPVATSFGLSCPTTLVVPPSQRGLFANVDFLYSGVCNTVSSGRNTG